MLRYRAWPSSTASTWAGTGRSLARSRRSTSQVNYYHITGQCGTNTELGSWQWCRHIAHCAPTAIQQPERDTLHTGPLLKDGDNELVLLEVIAAPSRPAGDRLPINDAPAACMGDPRAAC